ncbi:unnamed protein product [Paramecium sonneborni]|uniref:Uncharacterized protein n=1 Tax=Paramecium sonneborni TaxID=65129 RepID=A0A8S1KL10_9CILI|nr:unnamed protein product [Paramecium sonneborni]
MKTLHFQDQTFIQPYYTPRGDSYRYDYHKQQTMQLLNKVKRHLQKCDSTRYRSERRSPVDVKYLDNQLRDEVKDDYVEQNADQEFKILNGTCLKEMLAYNNMHDVRKSDEELEFAQTLMPKQRKLKKLQSTILVTKLVRAKGIDKKSIQQIDKEKLEEFMSIHKDQIKTEKKTKLHKLKLPNIPEASSRRFQRATITTFREFKQNSSEVDGSPLVQRQTSLTLISDTKIPIVRQGHSKKTIGLLIDRINEEKTAIIEQKKDIKTSIAKVQKHFDKLDIFSKLDRQEKFNYLKFEQRIFGKGKHKRYF